MNNAGTPCDTGLAATAIARVEEVDGDVDELRRQLVATKNWLHVQR